MRLLPRLPLAAALALGLAGSASLRAEAPAPTPVEKTEAIVDLDAPEESPDATPTPEQAAEANRLADLVQQSLARAQEVELLWLLSDPYTAAKPPVRPRTKEVVASHAVYAKSKLRFRPQLDILARTLVSTIRRSNGTGMKCFYPGPTLRFRVEGKLALLILCFACDRGELHLDGTTHSFTLGRDVDAAGNWLHIFEGHGIKPTMPRRMGSKSKS